MSGNRRHLERICQAALDRDPHARSAFLAEACAGDDALRREVELLLAYEPAADDFMEAHVHNAAAEGVAEHDVVIGQSIGPYQVMSWLGAGGMGEVYRARDVKLGRDVALKILPRAFMTDPERRARFAREARVLAALNHPHIAAIYGFEEADPSTSMTEGLRALVLELVEGTTLAERLSGGPVLVREALGLARQLADALEAAHGKGIVHRDLKPANIKVTPDGVVKVLDFGLAKALTTDGASEISQGLTVTSEGTREGLLLGTAAYMSPEQARGEGVDKRTDIWAFGCVLYEMLTGRAVFARDTRSDTIAAIFEREPEWAALPRSTPPTIRRMLRRCLDKDSRARMPHIAAVKEAISQVVDELESKHRAFSYSHGLWKVAVVVASAVLAAGVIAFRTWPLGDSDGVQTPAPISPIEASPVHRQLTFIGNVTAAGLSPDGRTFAYTTGGRLLVQDVGGGPSIEIARGKILRPRWSPRGDRLAFHPFEEGGIRIVSRLGGPVRQVTPEPYSAWSPDGLRMAVAYQNTLRFKIIDVKDGRVLRSVVLPGLGILEGIEWHPRLDRLALLERVVGDRWVIWTVTPDGTEGRAVHAESQAISSMCWSPVENILYFLRSQNEAAELMAMDLDDTASPSPRVLLSGLPNGGSLTISGDGRSLLHIRSSGNSNLARLNLKGPNSSLEFITKGTQRFDLPSVAPDGQWVAARVGIEPRTHLVKIPITGGEPIPLTSGDNFDGAPAWSPDGTRIAFASSSAGTTAVWLIRSDGTQLERVDNSTPSINLMTTWTPDGRLMWQEMTHGNQLNYRIRDLSSGEDSLLLSGDNSGSVFAPEFSPNGKEVAVFWNRREGPRGIYVLSWPALAPRFITNSILGASAVGWSANGASIIAMSGGVWFVSTRNGKPRRIAGVSDVVTGDVAPDGESAVVSVKNWTADAWLIENFDHQAKVVREALNPTDIHLAY